MDALMQTQRLRTWYGVLLVAPFLGILAVDGAVGLLPSTPSDAGNFEPTMPVVVAGVVAAMACTALFVAVASRLRLHTADEVVFGWRRRRLTHGDVWGMAAILFALVAIAVPLMLGRAINRLVGEVSQESWRVDAKEDTARYRCEFRVDVSSRMADRQARLCVSRARGALVQVQDAFPVVIVTSGLGVQIGPGPESNQKAGGR